MAKKKLEPEVIAHGDKLKKNIEDVKFVIILLSVLIAIVGGWNVYNGMKIAEAKKLAGKYDKVRKEVMDLGKDDEFLVKAKKIRERNNSGNHLKKFVEDIIESGAVVDKSKWGLMAKRGGSGGSEEYLSTPPVDVVTMKNLVLMLNKIKRNSLDIWCTEINKLEPILDTEGFASREYGNDVHYKIHSMRFSRFIKKD